MYTCLCRWPLGASGSSMGSLEAFAAQLGQIEVLSEHLYNSTVSEGMQATILAGTTRSC